MPLSIGQQAPGQRALTSTNRGRPRQLLRRRQSSKFCEIGRPSPDAEPKGVRRLLGIAAAGAFCFLSRRPKAAVAKSGTDGEQTAVVPLTWRNGAFFLRFRLADAVSKVGDAAKTVSGKFWGAVDTGSPFVLVSRCFRKDCAAYCAQWGCFSGQGQPSGLADTVEVYVSGESQVKWRNGAELSFPDSAKRGREPSILPDVIFGVQGSVNGSGGAGDGVLFGLIRNRSADIRPSFLEQTPFTSVGIDLRKTGRETLTLSSARLIAPRDDALELVDLRSFGAPVSFYAACAKRIRVGGEELFVEITTNGKAVTRPRRVLCIFDTGTTGVSMTRGLYNAYWSTAQQVAQRDQSAMSKARRLEVVFELPSGRELPLDMFRGAHPAYGSGLDLVTPVEEVAWAGLGDPASVAGYSVPEGVEGSGRGSSPQPFDDVAFLGLGFFVGRNLEVDTLQGRLRLSGRTEVAV